MSNDQSTTKIEPQPIPGFVQIINRGASGEPPQWASRLIWWLVRMAVDRARFQASIPPQVGDIVVECSHAAPLAKLRLGLVDAVGELVEIRRDVSMDEPTIQNIYYVIETLEGKRITWTNALIAVIERPLPTLNHKAGLTPENKEKILNAVFTPLEPHVGHGEGSSGKGHGE